MILLNLCNEEDFERAKRIIQGAVGGNAGDGVVYFCVDPPSQIVDPQDLLRHPPQKTLFARQQIANRSALILVDELRICTRRLDIRFLACNLPKDVCDKLLQVVRQESAKRNPKFKLSILGPGDRFPFEAEVDKVISNAPIKSATFPLQCVTPAKSIAPMQSATPTLYVAPVQSVTPTQRVTPSPTYSTPPSSKQAVAPNQASPKTLPVDLLKLQSDYEALLGVRTALAKFQSIKRVLISTEREQLEQVERRCAQVFSNQPLDDVVRELSEKRQELANFEHLLQQDDAPPTAEQDLWIKSRNDARGKIISLSQPLLTLTPICAENAELKQKVEHARLAARQCIDAIQTPPQPPAKPLPLLWSMLIHYLYLFACAILARVGWKLSYSPHEQPAGLIRTVEMHSMEFDDEEVKKLQSTLSKQLSHKQFQEAKQCLRKLILLCQFNDEREFVSLLDIAEEECNKLVEYRSLLARAATKEDLLHHQELAKELMHAHELLGQIPELKRAWLTAIQVDPNDAKCALVYLGINSKVQKIANSAFPELVNRPLSEWMSVTEVGNMEEEEDVDDFRSTLEKNDALLTEELSEYALEGLPERMLVTLGRVKSNRVFGAVSETNDNLYVFKRFMCSSNNKNANVEEIKHMRAALEISRQILHPSILRCLGGLLIDNNHACLQFPYMLGGDLKQWCRESAPRSFPHKLNALCGLIGAITELHKNDIVHRNINPSNVVLACNGVPKLTGFDLAVKLGTATVPRLNTKSIFTAPDAMQDQNAVQMALRIKSQDLYSFAATCVAVLGFDCMLPVPPCQPIAMLHIKQDLFRCNLYEVMKACLSDTHQSRLETKHVYRVLTLRKCEICNSCAGKELFYSQGVTCLQGTHFYCEADFDAYVKSECGKPLVERNAEGKIHCFQCEDAPKAFPSTALHKHMELINQSNAEVITAKANMEAEHKVRLRLEEDRKLGAVASHCKHIVEEILTARCGQCKVAFVDFTGCCALTCGNCGAHFCAFCFHVDATSPQSHEHVSQCNVNPLRGEYHVTKEQYKAQQRTRKAQLLRTFLDKLPPDQRQQVQRDRVVAENMRELGMA